MLISNEFELLKNVMTNAFLTETNYYEKTMKETISIPQEILNIMCPNFSTTDSRILPSVQKPNRRFFIIKTNLDFYFILFYLNVGTPTPNIVIGPFRSNTISLDSYFKKMETFHLTSNSHTALKNYYINMPAVSVENIVNTASHLIHTFLSKDMHCEPVYVDFANLNNYQHDIALEFDDNISNIVSDHQIILELQKTLSYFVNAATFGNSKTAQTKLQQFLTQLNFYKNTDISHTKRCLYIINDYFQIILLFSHIQPISTAKLIAYFETKIQNTTTYNDLARIPNEMCTKYCALFQNNTFPEYPKTVNDVINYIHTHIQEPLSLSYIAEHFHKNASTLSNSFTQSTGVTITNFIQQVRITRATEYFNATSLSVSEVALAVGFQDFAYFSRVFHKHMGCSPKEYRNTHLNQ